MFYRVKINDSQFEVKCPMCRTQSMVDVGRDRETTREECCICLETADCVNMSCGHSNTCTRCIQMLNNTKVGRLVEVNHGRRIDTHLYKTMDDIFRCNKGVTTVFYKAKHDEYWYVKKGRTHHSFFNMVVPCHGRDYKKLASFLGKSSTDKSKILHIDGLITSAQVAPI